MSINLRLIESRDDFDALFRIMNSDDGFLFTFHRGFFSREDFDAFLTKKLAGDYHDFYLVESGGEVVGFVADYDFRLRDGHCQILAYIDARRRKLGLGARATAYFLKRLFEQYPLRKVYSMVFAFNRASVTANEKSGGTEEGRLEEYRYFDGKYYSMRIFSLTREQFYSKMVKYAF